MLRPGEDQTDAAVGSPWPGLQTAREGSTQLKTGIHAGHPHTGSPETVLS